MFLSLIRKILNRETADGIKDSLPLAMGYVPVAITFGILSKAYGFPAIVPILMSIVIYAGSSQFVGIQMLALGTTPLQIVLTIFIVNIRHFLMGTTITQRLKPEIGKGQRAKMAFLLTDEAFVYLSSKSEMPNMHYVMGFEASLYSAWIGGTLIGTIVPSNLSPLVSASLGITIYALFISLLIPSMKRSKEITAVCVTAGSGSFLLDSLGMSMGWRIVLVTIVVSFLGALLFREVRT